MHAQLLTLGFTKTGPKTYFSAEFNLIVEIRPDGRLNLYLPGKIEIATLTELEDTIVGGGFGEFGV